MGLLLEYERDRKNPGTRRVALAPLAACAASQWWEQAEAKGVRLVVEVAPEAAAETEPVILLIILRNLIENAVKYSRSGTVRVASEHERDTGAHRWTLTVSDQGWGIAPAVLPTVFQPFRRGDSRGVSGSGLGLTIAHEAAKALRAELTAESQLGVGTTFRLRLPSC